MDTTSTERRGGPRTPAIFAVALSSANKQARCGVSRNASERGLLVVTASRFTPEDRLELSVHVGDEHAERIGRIVRVDENSRESQETWRYRLAIELDDPLPAEMIERAQLLVPRSA